MSVTHQQIADALGVSVGSAYQLVSTELARIRQDTAEKAEELRQIEVDRLDALLHRLNSELATAIDVGDIARLFPSGGDVTLADLIEKGAVRKNSLVKVLGDGKLTVKVNVSAHKFSGSAREKITAAGGSATELS